MKNPQLATGRDTSNMPKIKPLNLSTYKYHALADYPNMIRQYGTTDSYSTQLVSCSFSGYCYQKQD